MSAEHHLTIHNSNVSFRTRRSYHTCGWSNRTTCGWSSPTMIVALYVTVTTVFFACIDTAASSERSTVDLLRADWVARQRPVKWLASGINPSFDDQPLKPQDTYEKAYSDRDAYDTDEEDSDATMTVDVRTWWPIRFDDKRDTELEAEKRTAYQVPDLCRRVCGSCHARLSLTVSALCTDQCILGAGRHYEACHALFIVK